MDHTMLEFVDSHDFLSDVVEHEVLWNLSRRAVVVDDLEELEVEYNQKCVRVCTIMYEPVVESV